MRKLWLALAILLGLAVPAFAQPTNCLVPITAAASPVFTTVTSGAFIAKSSPGCLISLYVVTPAISGFLITINSATVPADGAITPVECVPVAASSYQFINFAPQPPEWYSNGIVAIFSTTGCFTKTVSTSAFFHALVQ